MSTLIARLCTFVVVRRRRRLSARAGATSDDRRCLQGSRVPQPRADAHDGPRRRHRGRSEQPERLLRGVRRRRACGKATTAATRGRRSSTTAARSTCAASSSIRRTRTSSGSARARTRIRAARCTATASTSRPTAAKTWTRVGLENSEHIGNIKIDPRNSDVVYVAAQGPLWSAGGDRGVFKTTDGGKTWKAVLHGERRHRRQRGPDRSEQPGRPLRVDVAAASRRRPDDRRRTGERDLQVDERRRRPGRS